jgi:hypothetical protein
MARRNRPRKFRTGLSPEIRLQEVTQSARGERAVAIGGYNAHDESEAILAELPGGTIAERLDSAKRGLFLGGDEPEERPDRSERRHQFECSCGYIARVELMDAHQEKHRYRGIHADRKPFIQRTPTDQ